MATATSNYEEATTVATEFISSLDNLPNEVQHILNEISHLEKKSQDLQTEIARDQRRYIRDVLRPSSTPLSFSAGSDNSGLSGSAKANTPRRIASSYAEMDNLSNQKIELAGRLTQLLTRTQARLDADVTKIRILQGEPALQGFSGSLSANVATQISENLRSALDGTSTLTDQITIALAPPTAGTASSSQSNKKRKITTQTSIKLTAPSPATSASTAYSRSRPSRQVQANKVTLEEPDDEDLDAEGEDDFEGDEGEEDPTLYCFCQKRSFGDMIGCDNTECPYQWFHISCVGVKTPLPDKWYCPECLKNKGVPERRKGRKK